jgi:SCF-associated factor 1
VRGLKRIPALQHNNVISVAFGDYHYHALHSTGEITSYGAELQSCGALGLGNASIHQGRLRGIDYNNLGHERRLLSHAYTHGRQVWFHPGQRDWLKFMSAGGKDPQESEERFAMFSTNTNVQGEVSEWIEQEGKSLNKNKCDDGLGAYFALRVSAAGWHSGALVLVNDDLTAQGSSHEWQDQSFPRLKLSNGQEMPGTVPFDEWRNGRPDWKLDVLD